MGRLFISNVKVEFKPTIKPFFNGFKSILHKFIPISSKKNIGCKPSKTVISSTSQVDFSTAPVDEWQVKMIARWKLLADSPTEGIGNLYLYAPSKEAAGFKYLIEQYQIEAVVHSSTIAV